MRPTIVAELSANHLGSLDRARELVKAASRAGADAVKFQTFDPDRLVAPGSRTIVRGPWAGHDLRELYRTCQTPREWHKELFDLTHELGMVPFSSAFSCEDVDFLATLGYGLIIKIASFECVDIDLIRHAASKAEQVVISTGMASEKEVAEACANAYHWMEKPDVVLLKCTSAYPAGILEANVAGIERLRELAYLHGGPKASVGLSDHTMGIHAAGAAVALGASMIEKHLTLSRKDGGPDAAFSMEPDEFSEMVFHCRRVAEALGSKSLGATPPEGPQAELRRSLWVVADVAHGEVLTRENLRSCRPSTGIPAGDIQRWLGKRAAREMKSGTPFGGAPDVMTS